MVEPLEGMRIATAKMKGMVGKARDQVEQRIHSHGFDQVVYGTSGDALDVCLLDYGDP